ncbi:unnamed protein product [Heligmosomoides polygyrus]|uniref:Protein kinase domain-containing protein n=1 Tax=Heligmosomoides polygyrus TaxID=6339 RepID=A0A183GN48_HELPZ|nr:unnamed protein product [Heligmosomoides polygyrus]
MKVKAQVVLKRAIRLAKWEFTPQAVQVGKLLNTGAFGETRQGRLTLKDGSMIDVAVKMMKGHSDMCRQQVKEMVREARLMRGLSHPNIVYFYGVCLQEQPIYILFELIRGGPLDAYLLENKATMKGHSDMCRQQVKEMVREARLMRGLSHPNIVYFYGVCLQEQPIYILFELIRGSSLWIYRSSDNNSRSHIPLPGGPLDAYLLENKATVTNDERLQIVMGVCWGLEYLHSKGVLHRDIAAKNCLYDTLKNVKISEFGLSRQGTTYSMRTARKMPIKWMAPESIKSFVFSQKSDAYSFGVSQALCAGRFRLPQQPRNTKVTPSSRKPATTK